LPTSSFARGAAAAGAKKTTSSFAKGVSAADSPWKPVLSFGQTLIDIVSTPLYTVTGGIAAAQKGQNPIVGAAENSVAWANGKRPATGSDLLKNAGMSNDFWSSLAADIALDPITYTPGVFISAPIKAVLSGTKYALKGSTAAVTKRAVSETAAKITKAPTLAPAEVISPTTKIGPLKTGNLTSEAALQRTLQAKDKIAQYTYKPIEVSSQRNISQAMAQMLASGLEAGYKGARVSLANSFLKSDLAKINRQTSKIVRKGGIVAAPKFLEDVADDVARDITSKPETDITPAAVVTEAANAARADNIAVLDPSATKVAITPLELQALQKPVGKITAKSEAAKLNKIDKLVQGIKLTTTNKADITKRVGILLGTGRQNIYRLFADKVPQDPAIAKNMGLALKLDGTDPIKLLKQFADSPDPTRQNIVKALATTIVSSNNGVPVLVSNLLTDPKYAGNYADLGGDIKTKLTELFSMVTKIASGGNAAIAGLNKNAIEDLVGRDVANAIGKTGAFDPSKTTDVAALKKILDELPDAQQKTYKNFDEFISGVRAQDPIDIPTLEKVLRLLDPENAALDRVDKALASGRSTDVLRTALTTSGVTTVREIRRNLANMDPEVLMKSTDVSFSDVAFATANDVLRGLKEPDLAAASASREAAGQSLVEARAAGLGSFIDDAADSIGRGLSVQIGKIFKTTEEGVSKLGQLYSRAYRQDGSTEAYLNNFVSQYVETTIIGSLLGKATFRKAKGDLKRERDIAEGRAPKQAATLEQVNSRFILQMQTVSDILLSVHGVRITHIRSSKAAKGKPENSYHHYVNIGDVATVFDSNGSKAFMKLMFPSVAYPGKKIIPQSDSLSLQTIGDTVSAVLFALEKNTKVNATELIKQLKKASPGKTWSADYTAIVEENIGEFVDFIAKNAEDFAAVHKTKLKAEIIDLAQPAQRMSSAMFDTMLDAYSVMRDKGVTSQYEKDKIAYEWMLKFAVIADIFATSNGSVAREAFRSTARIFFELSNPEIKGVVATEYRQKLAELATSNPNSSDVYDDMMKAFETFPKWEKSVSSQIPGVDKNLVDAAEKSWIVAKSDFDASLNELTSDMTPEQVVIWRKGHKAIEEALVRARTQLGKAGIESDYWNGQAWVTADRYNRKAALRALEAMPNRFVYTKSGPIDISRFLVDSEAVTPTFKQFGVKQTAETKKIFEDIAAQRRTKIAKDDKATAQEEVLADMSKLDAMFPDDAMDLKGRADDEVFIRRFEQSRSTVDIETPPPGAKQADGETDIPAYFPEFRYKTASLEAGSTLLQRAGQKLMGGAGFRTIAPLLARTESTAYNAISDTAEVMTRAFKLFRKAEMKTEQMDNALNAAVNKTALDAVADPNAAELARIFGKVWDSVTQHVVDRGLHPKYIKEAFRQMNIDRFVPNWEIYDKPEDINRILSWLPIGDPPAYIMQGVESTDKIVKNRSQVALDQYNTLKNDWLKEVARRDDSVGSIAMFHKAVAAIQNASSEATLASMLVEDFNFMQYYPGMSKQAARKAAIASGDFVVIKEEKLGSSLVRWFPEEDNLFPRQIAKQIGAMERHYNYTMENNMGKFIQTSMTILGIFKTTQTVLRPGHLINTTVGDSITSIMRGTNPLMFKDSTRLVMKFAGDKIAADWNASQGGKRMALLEQSLRGLTKRELAEAESGMTFNIGGKVTLSDEEMITLLRDAGALRTNISANDELIQMAELRSFQTGTDQATSYNKTMLEKTNAKAVGATAKRIWLTATKPAGDAVAYAGNIPRTATALDVLKKGSFKNREEAVRAINEELNIYHPMIESLSAWERQKVRPLFSYYTWLKGAHYAMLKMATEHTRAMVIPSKIFYNQALANQMDPGSIGNLWGDKEESPSYLNYSTYGPTSKGPRGAIVYRPSVLPLDVLDTWNIQFDPTKSVDKQTFDNINTVGQSVIGKNINMVFQPGIEFITGTDPGTGSPSAVKDLKSAGDSLLSNIGTMQLFQGLGLYTPPNKGPESTNPLTERDRFLKTFNFFTGARAMDTEAPSSIRNARSDYNARMKRIQEILLAEQDK
jgi:hypothetical protein